jgi:hypothetical protein
VNTVQSRCICDGGGEVEGHPWGPLSTYSVTFPAESAVDEGAAGALRVR